MVKLKYFLEVTLAMCAISCTNEALENKTALSDANEYLFLTDSDLKMRKLIAPLHGEGLDFVQAFLKQEKTTTRSISMDSSKLKKITEQFMQTSKVENVIANYIVNYTPVQTRSIGIPKEYTEHDIQKVQNHLNDFVQKCDDHNILQEIDRFLAVEPLDDLDELERSVLVLSLFVYEDSYHYWSNAENFNKWENLKDKPITRIDWEAIWETVKKYANVDAGGAVSGGIGGAAGGAAVGGMAGGVGALPGATTGFVSGAVAGAVTSSVAEALN